MKTALAVLLLISLACHSKFLGEGINFADYILIGDFVVERIHFWGRISHYISN